MKNKLPNFLVVGAAKSGTSSLHQYLIQHPDVFMPDINKEGRSVKEPQFLVKDKVKNRLHFGVWNWEEYVSLFNDVKNEKCIGEASVFYLYFYREAIKNIKSFIGTDVKIIIVLRDPIERAYSAFNHVSKSAKENLSFEESLIKEGCRLMNDETLTPMVMYKSMGLYYNMVKAYKENFKDVHIVLYDDFSIDSRNELNRIFRFLDVNKYDNINLDTQHNVGGRIWKNKVLKRLFLGKNRFKSFLINITPVFIMKSIKLKLVNLSKNKVKPIKDQTREELQSFFKDDINKLSELINKNLTHWAK